MTKEMLESYKSKQDEIRELEYKLEHMMEGDRFVGNSTILDYRKGYPQPQAVIGVNWGSYTRLRKRYTARLEQLKKECVEIEDFIEAIEDSLTRRIMRMHYIDGLEQGEIAKRVFLHRSSISKKISRFLKVSHNSHETTV